MKKDIIKNRILSYYKNNKRKLPWRTKEDNNQNPYHTLVSEVMLQQTQVKTATSYYKRFIKKWPNIKSLSNANLDEVLVMWSGLGYYNRAKNLLKSAKIITTKFRGNIPSNKESLISLPGIGDYTSAAIMSFAFGKHALAIDTNIKRFFIRVFGLNNNKKNDLKQISIIASRVFPKNNSGKFAQALMDFSSDICKKKNQNVQDAF